MNTDHRELWTFDRLDRIGNHPTTVLGDPRVVDTPVGKAIEFDGVDDARATVTIERRGPAFARWDLSELRPGKREGR